MKRLPTLLGLLLSVVPLTAGCGSTGAAGGRFTQPSSLMKQFIQEKIDQIPFQHGEELIINLQWLVQSGEQSIPQLRDSLNNPEAKLRSSVAWVLGQIGNKRAVKILRRHARDPQPVVRYEIARALLLLGDFTWIPELINGLESELQGIRYRCFEILSKKTGQTFDYDFRSKDATARKASALKWRIWWRTQNTDEWFKRGLNPAVAGPYR